MKTSVVIANFNNEKYIEQCIKSLKSQTYKDLEIIFFDDNSSDNSLDKIKKFSNIKVIENKKQTKYGSINQLNAFKESVNQSTGDLIFFLDSDDYFHEDKVEKIRKFFLKRKDIDFVQNLPFIKNDFAMQKKKNKNNPLSFWPYLAPESCISFRKKFFSKFIKINQKYTNNFDNILCFSNIFFSFKYINYWIFV